MIDAGLLFIIRTRLNFPRARGGFGHETIPLENLIQPYA